MKLKHRALALLLVMAMALSLVSCSNKATVTADVIDAEHISDTSMTEDADTSAEPVDEGDVSAESSAQPELEQAPEPEPEPKPEEEEPEVDSDVVPDEWDKDTTFEYTLCFSGDINLAEGQYTTSALDAGGLDNCVSETLRKNMTQADLMCVNNEFTYTTSSKALADKTYTFKANPSRVDVMKKLGADIAVLANNHVFDYREQGLEDTLKTLKEAEIATIGAGKNLDEASAVYYAELENCTVAYIAASRVEWSAKTQPATKDKMGVFYTAYDTDLLYQRVKEAKEKADYVVVCMHWGTEGTADLEEYQTKVGKELVEAGADVVVGDHPHQLQGVKFVDETPVFYSLGNYWFGRKEEYTMLLNVKLSGDKYGVREVSYEVVPAMELSSARVIWLESSKQQRAMFDYLEALPGSNVDISDEGIITKK